VTVGGAYLLNSLYRGGIEPAKAGYPIAVIAPVGDLCTAHHRALEKLCRAARTLLHGRGAGVAATGCKELLAITLGNSPQQAGVNELPASGRSRSTAKLSCEQFALFDSILAEFGQIGTCNIVYRRRRELLT